MPSLRQYFDTDFTHAVRVHLKLPAVNGCEIDGALFYDFSGCMAFLACFVAGDEHELEFYLNLVRQLDYGKTQLIFDGKLTLPSAKQFHGELRVENNNPLGIRGRFFGDPTWVSTNDMQSSRRVFVYSECQLSEANIVALKDEAGKLGHNLQFRSKQYVEGRTRFELPLAFICHDSRDKDDVARNIAVGLQRMLCPVWYDDFSLKVGDNLRTSIEAGIKECKKCILVLSKHFFSNRGWTKKEFDSIFTREVLEERGLVLPVWYGVTKHQVYDYSPSLLNVKGLEWGLLGEDEVCRQLFLAINTD